MRRSVISDAEWKEAVLPRIEAGESFSAIARDYGVTPWAIQKRYKKKKPKRFMRIWGLVPDFQDVCLLLHKKYAWSTGLDVYGLVADWALSLPEKQVEWIASGNDSSHKRARLYLQLRRRLFIHYRHRKGKELLVDDFTNYKL